MDSINTEMLEIISKRTYGNFIMLYTIVLFCGFVVLSIFENVTLLISVVLFLTFELFIFSKKSTRSIKVTKTTLEITYFKWGRRHFMTLNLPDVRVQAGRVVENRGHKFRILNVSYKGELVYIINVSDGFEDADLNKVQMRI